LLGALQLAHGSGALDAASLAAALARTEEALPGTYLDLAQALRRSLRAPSERQRHRAAMVQLVQAALAEGRCLAVVYESASGTDVGTERVLRPYLIEPYEHSWMVTAHDSLRQEVRYFKIDRIVRARLLEERYAIPEDFDAAAYRGAGWGIVRGMAGEPVNVVLRFSAEEGRRVRDDEYHASQQEERQEDGSWLVRFHVGITPELVRWVFRWGVGCEVLAPEELRVAVAEQAWRIAAVNGAAGGDRGEREARVPTGSP
jgi:predicted DNA-binding transcriptional regulator YafY